MVVRNEAGAGVCNGNLSSSFGGGLCDRELELELELAGDGGDGEAGLSIVMAGAGVAGTVCSFSLLSFSWSTSGAFSLSGSTGLAASFSDCSSPFSLSMSAIK